MTRRTGQWPLLRLHHPDSARSQTVDDSSFTTSLGQLAHGWRHIGLPGPSKSGGFWTPRLISKRRHLDWCRSISSASRSRSIPRSHRRVDRHRASSPWKYAAPTTSGAFLLGRLMGGPPQPMPCSLRVALGEGLCAQAEFRLPCSSNPMFQHHPPLRGLQTTLTTRTGCCWFQNVSAQGIQSFALTDPSVADSLPLA